MKPYEERTEIEKKERRELLSKVCPISISPEKKKSPEKIELGIPESMAFLESGIKILLEDYIMFLPFFISPVRSTYLKQDLP